FLERNDQRERCRSRSLFLSMGIMAIAALIAGSPAYHKAPLDLFFWCLMGLMFVPLLLHILVFSIWRPIHPMAVCYHCGMWFFKPEMDQIARTGFCPNCGHADPLPPPEVDEGNDEE